MLRASGRGPGQFDPQTYPFTVVPILPVFERTFEGRIEQIPAIREFVGEAAEAMHISAEDTFACQLVVDEAATNAFRHSYRDERGRVEVRMWLDEDTVVLTVRNWGAPFDLATLPEPDIHKPLEERQPGGLGVLLMRRFADEVLFDFDQEKGNTVLMRRRLHPPDDGREGAH